MRVTLQTFSTSHSKISPTRSAILPLIAFFFFLSLSSSPFQYVLTTVRGFHKSRVRALHLRASLSRFFFFFSPTISVSPFPIASTNSQHTLYQYTPGPQQALNSFCAFFLRLLASPATQSNTNPSHGPRHAT
jgi:hypothetical protein